MGIHTESGTVSSSLLHRVNEFVYDCGQVHNPRDFCIYTFNALNSLVPYDQGQVQFFDENGNVCSEHLCAVKPNIRREYHEHYSKIDGNRYMPFKRSLSEGWHTISDIDKLIYDWTTSAKKE